MVESTGLENQRLERVRGFESHPLRQNKEPCLVQGFLFSGWDENPGFEPSCEAARPRPSSAREPEGQAATRRSNITLSASERPFGYTRETRFAQGDAERRFEPSDSKMRDK